MLFTLKLIGGILKKVGIIKYDNGTVVERVYPVDSNVPEDVRVIQHSRDAKNTKDFNPHVAEHIVNQEYLQYQYHFGQ